MTYKREAVRRITKRLFPSLEGMTDELKPVLVPGMSKTAAIVKVRQILEVHAPDFESVICDRASRRRKSRGRVVGRGPADWNIHENDAEILLADIKLWDYIRFRLLNMDNLRFVRLCERFDEKYAAADKAEKYSVDATRFFSFAPANMSQHKWIYWNKMATLTAEEAVALSLSKDPDVVSSNTLANALRSDHRPSLFHEQYQQRIRALQRACGSGMLMTPLLPAVFLQWAGDNGFDIAAEFAAPTAHAIPPAKNDANSLDIMNPKSRHTLRLILLCMAIDKYGHKLNGNSPAITKIVDAVTRLRFSINRDTVRDMLTDAAADESIEQHLTLLNQQRRPD